MTITVRDFSGSGKQVKTTAISTASPDANDHLPHHNLGAGHWELVNASATTQSLGATGAAGDCLARLIIVPETTGAGTVAIRDGAGSDMNVFIAGTLADLRPIVIELWMISLSGAWKVTTGSNVHVIAVGNFT